MNHYSTWIYVFLFLISFALSFLFSMTEIALLSIGQDRVKQLVEEGGKIGKLLSFWDKKSNGILISILLWDTFVNTFVTSLATFLTSHIFGENTLLYVVTVMSALVFFFGEVFPKTVAKNHAELLAPYGIIFFKPFYYFAYPLTTLVEFILRIFLGKKANPTERMTTQDDIEYLVHKAEREQTLNEIQIDLLNSALEFPLLRVQDVMVAQSSTVIIFIDDNYDEIVEKIKDYSYDYYSVYDQDDFLGVIQVKDLLLKFKDSDFSLQKIIQKPLHVFQKVRIQRLFEEMREKEIDIATVYDENHNLVGLITIDDIVHQISGSKREIQEGEKIDRGWIIPGTISLLDLYSEYDIDLPQEEHYATLNGFLLDILGNDFPKKGQIIYFQNYIFEIYKVVDYKIIEVLVRKKD